MSRENIAMSVSVQAQAIQYKVELPKATSAVGTLSDEASTAVQVLITQRSSLTHLRYLIRPTNQHLFHTDTPRATRGVATIIRPLQPYLTFDD